ncbi:MAG: PAS domain-containing protein [Planctomycetes bacterium]|nr:PAS domain-containing protein [Planctomycetota bacterium]
MPVFFSLNSDSILAALSIALLLAGVICLSLSREKRTPSSALSWRHIGMTAIIMSFRDWWGVVGISEPGYTYHFILAAMLQMVATIPLLLATRAAAADRPNLRWLFRIGLGLVGFGLLASLIGPVLSPRLPSVPLIEVVFFSVRVIFFTVVVLFAWTTATSAAPPGRDGFCILCAFSLYFLIVAINPPPGLPAGPGHTVPLPIGLSMPLYGLRLILAFGIAAMAWSIYAKSVGVSGRIRWWPFLFMFAMTTFGFALVHHFSHTYQAAVRHNIEAETRNIAALVPRATLAHVAEQAGSANNPEVAQALFGRLREHVFHFTRTPVAVSVDILALDPDGAPARPVIDIANHRDRLLWAASPDTMREIHSQTLANRVTLRGLYAAVLEPVLAMAPIVNDDGQTMGAVVLSLSPVDLVIDLYRFKRLALLLMPPAILFMLLLLGSQQRAWLTVHSSSRAEALKLGALGNDLSGVLVTRDDIIVDVNQRLCDMTGTRCQDLLGKNVHQAFAVVAVDGIPAESTHHGFTRGDGVVYEVALNHPERGTVTLMVFGRKLTDDPSDGHSIWESVDITSLKNMETGLRQARDHLQQIIDSLTMPVFVKDGDGRYELVNQAFVHVIGKESKEEVIGRTSAAMNVREMEDSADQDEVARDMRGATHTYEQRLYLGDEERVYEVSKTLKRLGGATGGHRIIGSAFDITARKAGEDALKTEQHFLFQLINTLPVIVCFVDPDRIVRLCDQEFCREVGVRRPEDIIGLPYDEVSPFGLDEIQDDRHMLQRGGGFTDSEFETDKHDRHRTFILRRIVMTAADGRVLGLVKAFWDTTALVAANRAARSANRAKSAFLSNMSHELRTPMNGIVGMADLIIEHESTEPVQRLYAETIIKSSKTLQMVIDEVMDIATFEDDSKHFSTDQAPFPLLALVEESAEIVSCIIGAWGNELFLTYDFNLRPMYSGDARRIRQIIVQILTHNARLAADRRVRLEASLLLSEDERDRVALRSRFRPVAGVTAAGLEEMFKSADLPERQGGIFQERIGLPLVWRLIQAMGGSLRVSHGGGEILCEVSLDLKPEASAGPALMAPVLKGMRVLLAVAPPDVDAAIACMTYVDAVIDVAGTMDDLRQRFAAGGPGGKKHHLLLLDTRFATAEEISTFLKELEKTTPETTLMLVVTARDVQNLPVVDERFVNCLLVPPLCPSEIWFKAERLWLAGDDLTAKRPTRRSTRITRTVAIPATVLLVEDNTVNQMVEMGILKKIGCHPTLAKNGAEAVERITAGERYDLILMDCIRRVMDGYEATGRIRLIEKTRPGTERNTIVALTANTVAGDKEKCLASGMDDYVTKPVTLEMIREVLFRHCPDRITLVDRADT